ncbi:glycine zipper 2TM domain-containing protein [Pseudoroseomonas wenyumeiae]
MAGGVAGSFIGGDWRSNLLAGLGGAVIGGALGNAVERNSSTGQAVEFFVRQDNGGDIAVVQTNEENLQYNDRVVIIRGDTTRISRAAGSAPPVSAAPPRPTSPAPRGRAGQPTTRRRPPAFRPTRLPASCIAEDRGAAGALATWAAHVV